MIHVPPGTVIIDAQNDFVIRDLTADGDSFVVARGGKGGRGNASFKGAQNQAARQFTRGDEGEHRVVIFELKAIADVGLIGKPNAGKSTLLSGWLETCRRHAGMVGDSSSALIALSLSMLQTSDFIGALPRLTAGAAGGISFSMLAVLPPAFR